MFLVSLSPPHINYCHRDSKHTLLRILKYDTHAVVALKGNQSWFYEANKNDYCIVYKSI